MTSLVLVLCVVAVLAVVIAPVLLIGLEVRRGRRVKSVRDKGWRWRDEPPLSITNGLNCPPFGVGFGRSVANQVYGTTDSGIEFSVFDYERTNTDRVAVLTLPFALPELYVLVDAERANIPLPRLRNDPVVHAGDDDYADRVLASIHEPLQRYLALDGRADLSLDGDHLVAVGMPATAGELEPRLEALDAIARALGEDLEDLAVPAPEPKIGFHGTDWTYAERDDGWLDRTVVERDGTDHQAVEVVHGPNDGLPFVSLLHRWNTEQWTNNGTRTVEHEESVLEVFLDRPFGELWVDLSGEGELIEFEASGFNRRFDIRAVDRRFAYAVVHPRQMEFFADFGAPPFSIDRHGRMRFRLGGNSTSPRSILHRLDFAHGFLGRVPSFVWKDLGVTDLPTFREVDPERRSTDAGRADPGDR